MRTLIGGVTNGTCTSKILGQVNVLSDLKISTAFANSFVYSAFISVSKSCMFGLGLGFSNKALGISASLGFYNSPPLIEYQEKEIELPLSPPYQMISALF